MEPPGNPGRFSFVHADVQGSVLERSDRVCCGLVEIRRSRRCVRRREPTDIPLGLKPVVATIERGLVLRKLGRLEEEDRAALRKVLDEILGG